MENFKHIKGFENWTSISKIEKGWSPDEKYYIETTTGEKFLLRTCEKAMEKRRRWEFVLLKMLNHMELNVPYAVDFSVDDSMVYTLLTWLEGDTLEEVLSSLDIDRQYAIGIEAGQILRKFHSLSAPADIAPWHEKYNAKIDKIIADYLECGIILPQEERIIAFVNDNRLLLRGRPQTFCHGDYHPGNMIFNGKKIGIIDFNRIGYADPYSEFLKLVWSAPISPHFAKGSIDGYLDASMDKNLFFKLSAYYTAVIQLSNIPWAQGFGQREIDTMIDQTKNVLEWYDNFNNYVPSWYDNLHKPL